MTDNSLISLAKVAAADFNRQHGAELLYVRAPRDVPSPDQVRQFAAASPGTYTVAALFLAMTGRRATHGEAIALGKQLAAMGYDRAMSGPTTFWTLDSSAPACVV